MESLCVSGSLWPSTTFSASQPVTVFQTAPPCFLLSLPHEVSMQRPPYVVGNYAGLVVPPRVIPRFYNTVTESPSPSESRFFFLDRSVFDLVDAHPYLSLTDPKLLKWYLSLCPEDRKIIQDEGGFHQFLQRHPALELSQHHVYVKYKIGNSGPAQPSMTSNMQLSRPSREKQCSCGVPHTLYPSNVRETVTLLRPQQHPHVELSNKEQLFYLQDSFHTAFNHPVTQEANHQQAGSSLCQLMGESPSWQMDSSSSSSSRSSGAAVCVDVELERARQWSKPVLWSQTSNCTYAEVHPLQSEWPTVKESPSVDTAHEDEACLRFEDPCEELCSIMEDDKSILVYVAGEDGKAQDTDTSNSGALSASGETLKSDQSVTKANTAAHTSPPPCVTTCDVRVGTEPAACTAASTQIEDPGSSDKHVITEVRMADLDYLAEEFIQLKTAKELREQKEQTKSPGCKVGKECECAERAQQAELCLLALQHAMCRQHCWRFYYTSAEEGRLTPLPKSPPVSMESVLQKLDSDYHHMREKILAGVPLEKLPPLSVDSERITTGGRYTPAQIVGDVLGNVPPRSEESRKHHTSGEENTSPDNESRTGCQRKEQPRNGKAKRAVTSVPQNRAAIRNDSKPTGLNAAETWYDAEEDVEPAGPAEIGQEATVMTKEKTCESDSEEAKTSALCVSNLPRNVTESDVMLWFEKYHVSEVNISALKNDLSVAIVTISGPQSVEAAVRELNGFSVRGHTLHVEHLDGSHHPSSEVPTKPQTSKTGASSPDRKVELMVQPPLGSSVNSRKVVSVSPTAKGTCVPRHYGTMDSFNTLMSELTQHHPDIGRQRIVDALMELKAKHQGALSGLPLSTIREMTSELLTTASTVQS